MMKTYAHEYKKNIPNFVLLALRKLFVSFEYNSVVLQANLSDPEAKSVVPELISRDKEHNLESPVTQFLLF